MFSKAKVVNMKHIAWLALVLIIFLGSCGSGSKPKNYELVVKIIGDGTGSVKSLPIGIDCEGDCSEEYRAGSHVVLTATAGNGSVFAGWSDDCAGVAYNCDLGLTSAKTVSARFQACTNPVNIPDANLQAAIKEQLGINRDITCRDMVSMTVLDSRDRNDLPDSTKIFNIEGLQQASNLLELNLDGDKVSDLSPLAKLTKLRELQLNSNKAKDLSPISNLTNLELLHVPNNGIKDISALAKLINLKYLYLYSNEISDISALANLRKLELIWLSGNYVKDISSLANLTKLKELSLYSNDISNILSLANLKQLERLQLFNNNIFDIQPLGGLTNLDRLLLDQNKIVDISALANLKQLTLLELDRNKISNIFPLADLRSLKELYLHENLIVDISVLDKLQSLEKLSLKDNLIKDISALVANAGLSSKDELSLEQNCLDISAGEDLKNINILLGRQINLSYKPQKNSCN